MNYNNILWSNNCIVCGKSLVGKVRIQNDVKGYVRCIGCDIKDANEWARKEAKDETK